MTKYSSVVKTEISSKIVLALYAIGTIYIVFIPFLGTFNYIDELIVLVLVVLSASKTRFLIRNSETKIFIGYFILYTIYSLFRQVNVPMAIVRDIVQLCKPLLCFYAVYGLKFDITHSQMRVLKKISIVLAIYCWSILPYINSIYGNTTHYYQTCLMSAIMYYFSSKKNRTANIMIFIMLIPGLAAGRSKYVTELVIYAYIIFVIKRRLQMNLKTSLIILLLALVAIWIEWTKFSMYFVTGMAEGQVRTMFYFNSFKIFYDYFPLGSGLATFGTDAAAQYYSPLYYKYGLYNFWGARPEDYMMDSDFLADTFYPIIVAQFGISGIYLFWLFFKKRWRELKKYSLTVDKFAWMLFVYIFIESIASCTIIGAHCVPIMILMAILCSPNVRFHEKFNQCYY